MYGFFMTILPVQIQFKTVCLVLDRSRETLRSLIKNDPTFPRPIKMGNSKQSPVYFDYIAIIEWHKAQMANIDSENKEINE